MKKIGKIFYIDTRQELSCVVGLSVRSISSLFHEGAPGKTEFGYPVRDWVFFLINRAKNKKRKIITQFDDSTLEEMIKELNGTE